MGHVQAAAVHIALAAFVGMRSSELLGPVLGPLYFLRMMEEEGREQRVAVCRSAICWPSPRLHHCNTIK